MSAYIIKKGKNLRVIPLAELITSIHSRREKGGHVGNRGADKNKKRKSIGKKVEGGNDKGVKVAFCPSYIKAYDYGLRY